jgi:two-component system sensor histidine kinase UhpB
MLLALGSRFGVVTSTHFRRYVLLAASAAAAYYLGSLLGFALRLPPTRISFLWPPTAILTAILLSIPTRSWPIAAAGAFAAHALAHSVDGIPTSTWLVQFAANCLQAALGAWLTRSIDAGVPFASLRNVTAFVIGVALVAPAVASLMAAHVYVTMGWSPGFWTAWRTRELSNVLAALTFTPPMMLLIARLRQAGDPTRAAWPVGSRVPLLSCALMVIAVAGGEYAVSPAAEGSGLTAVDRLLMVQVVIAAAAVPLMFLAAVLQERQAEHRQLRESQRRYALATAAGGVGVWEWNPSGRTYVDPRLSHRLGYHPHTDASLDKWWLRIHQDDRDRVKRHLAEFASAVDPFFEFECRVLARRGGVHWLFIRGAASRDDNGRLEHVIGTYIDVTEQRIASQALATSQTRLRELAARVISVQEDERARIARNLHDSASQTLAALAIRLSVLHRDAESGNLVRPGDLAHLRDMAIATGEQIRHVSHELHPAVLQRDGLPAALASYCQAFADDHLLRVTSACSIGDVAVSASSALCLYRVCQEALHNVAKHARASEVSVTLAATASTLQLIVHDDGCGFDQHALASGSGIGLSTLDERLRLLNGTLAVDSRLGEGTRILATLPIAEAA